MEGRELVPLSLPPRDRAPQTSPRPYLPRPISGALVQDSLLISHTILGPHPSSRVLRTAR